MNELYLKLQASIGEQNMQTAFWAMLGSLVLSNIGLIIGAFFSHIRKFNKMRIDINEAHKKLRELNNIINKEKKL